MFFSVTKAKKQGYLTPVNYLIRLLNFFLTQLPFE